MTHVFLCLPLYCFIVVATAAIVVPTLVIFCNHAENSWT